MPERISLSFRETFLIKLQRYFATWTCALRISIEIGTTMILHARVFIEKSIVEFVIVIAEVDGLNIIEIPKELLIAFDCKLGIEHLVNWILVHKTTYINTHSFDKSIVKKEGHFLSRYDNK